MNYTDLITHCPDVPALLAEVERVSPDHIVRDEDTNQAIGFSIAKTPTISMGAETVAVVRVTDAELALIRQLTQLRILAEAPVGGDLLAAMTPADRAIYDAVYDQSPVDITDDQGNVIGQSTPPALCGAFA